MSEEWRDIAGFQGRYQVSNFGRVRSFAHDKLNGRVMKITFYPNGYPKVTLGKGGPQALVHRLVAEAFVDGDTSLQVNHKNGVRSDCRVENLEWLSCSDNHRHSYRELSRKPHAFCRPVVLVKRGEELSFPSMKAAARFLERGSKDVTVAAARGLRCNGHEVHLG
jgi:hypothetical protein